MAKEIKKRGTTICLGCIQEFKNIELTQVRISDFFGLKFSVAFCEKCIKKENFPQHTSAEIVGPVAKPRKPREKKAIKKVTPKKTTKKVVPKKTTKKATPKKTTTKKK